VSLLWHRWQVRWRAWRARGAELSPALATYLRDYRPPEPSTPLDALRFVVVDTETSGLDLVRNRLLSVGAVAVHDGAVWVEDAFEREVRSDDVGGSDAAPVHGLVPQDLAGGGDELEVVEALLSYLGSSVFVAHHAAFDVAMIERPLAAHGLRLLNPVLDTEHLARRLDRSPNDPSGGRRVGLDALAERYGLGTTARHTAAGDALLTGMVLQRQLREAKARGIRTAADLL
jgi:DNA polymerase-3 subunit epsilon